MASVTVGPSTGITLPYNQTNQTITLTVSPSGAVSETLSTIEVALPSSCLKAGTQGAITATFDGQSATVTSTTTPNSNNDYVLTLTVSGGVTLPTSEFDIILSNVSTSTSTEAPNGNISLILSYDELEHGQHIPEQISANTINLTILDTSGSTTTEQIAVDPPALNAGYESAYQVAVYPSLLANGQLALPIANTVSVTFNWTGGTNAPASSSDGQFYLSFDYGGAELALNSLCSNDSSLEGTGLSVYDWPAPTLSSNYTSGSNNGDSIDWTISLNPSSATLNPGYWVLAAPSGGVDWQNNFSVTVNFRQVLSGNTSGAPLPSHIYVQSNGVTGVSDLIDVQAFNLQQPQPVVLNFTSATGTNSEIASVNNGVATAQFKYEVFGSVNAQMTWVSQNGSDVSTQNQTCPLDFDVSFPPTTPWSLYYSQPGSSGYSVSTYLNPNQSPVNFNLAAGGNTYGEDIAVSVPTSSAGASIVSYQQEGVIVGDSGIAAMLQWQVTGLGSSDYCVLDGVNDSQGNPVQFPGSTFGGNAPYTYLMNQSVDSSFALTVYDSSNQATSVTQTIDGTVTIPGVFPSSTVTDASGTFYSIYMGTDGSFNLFSSTDGATWTTLAGPSSSLYNNDSVVDPVLIIGTSGNLNIVYAAGDPVYFIALEYSDSSWATNSNILKPYGSKYDQISSGTSFTLTKTSSQVLALFPGGLIGGDVNELGTKLFQQQRVPWPKGVLPSGLVSVCKKNDSSDYYVTYQTNGNYTKGSSTVEMNLIVTYGNIVFAIGVVGPTGVYPSLPEPITEGTLITGNPQIIYDGDNGYLYLFYIDASTGLLNWYRSKLVYQESSLSNSVTWSFVATMPLVTENFSVAYGNNTVAVVQLVNDKPASAWSDVTTLEVQGFTNILPNPVEASTDPLIYNGIDLCLLNGILYLAYPNSSNDIDVTASSNGIDWTTVSTSVTGLSTVASPSLTTDGSSLYLSYVDSSTDNIGVMAGTGEGEGTWTFNVSTGNEPESAAGTTVTISTPNYPVQGRYFEEDVALGTLGAGLYTAYTDGANGYLATSSDVSERRDGQHDQPGDRCGERPEPGLFRW